MKKQLIINKLIGLFLITISTLAFLGIVFQNYMKYDFIFISVLVCYAIVFIDGYEYLFFKTESD